MSNLGQRINQLEKIGRPGGMALIVVGHGGTDEKAALERYLLQFPEHRGEEWQKVYVHTGIERSPGGPPCGEEVVSDERENEN